MATYTVRPGFTVELNGTLYTGGDQVNLTPEEFEDHEHKLEGTVSNVPSGGSASGGGSGSGGSGASGSNSTFAIVPQSFAIADWVLDSGKYKIAVSTGLSEIVVLKAYNAAGETVGVDYTDLGSGNLDVFVNEVPDARFDGVFKVLGE